MIQGYVPLTIQNILAAFPISIGSVTPPPYSPDLAPSDYHIFGALKDSLGGRKFASDEEVKEAVHEWLHTRPKNIFLAGIQAFPKRWATCITRVGDYVEK